jgi:hypothetical protein
MVSNRLNVLALVCVALLSVTAVSAQNYANWTVARPNIASIIGNVAFDTVDHGYVGAFISGPGPLLLETDDGLKTLYQENPGMFARVGWALVGSVFIVCVCVFVYVCVCLCVRNSLTHTLSRTRTLCCCEGFSPIIYWDVAVSDTKAAVTVGVSIPGKGAALYLDQSTGNWTQSATVLAGSNFIEVESLGSGEFRMVGSWTVKNADGKREGHNGVASSSDGGRTWSFADWPLSDLGPTSASWVDSNTAYVSAGQLPAPPPSDDPPQQVYRMSHGCEMRDGSMYYTQPEMSADPAELERQLTDARQQAVQVDSQIPLNETFRAVLMRTSDGGQTWETLIDDTSDTNSTGMTITSVHFVNADVGFITGELVVQGFPVAFMNKTVDGGKTWNPVYAVPAGVLLKVKMYNETFGFAVGGAPKYVCSACSVVFSRVFSPACGCFFFLSSSSSSHIHIYIYIYVCVCVCVVVFFFFFLQLHFLLSSSPNGIFGFGLVLNTTDGGNTWQQSLIPKFLAINNVDIVDPSHAYAVGVQSWQLASVLKYQPISELEIAAAQAQAEVADDLRADLEEEVARLQTEIEAVTKFLDHFNKPSTTE